MKWQEKIKKLKRFAEYFLNKRGHLMLFIAIIIPFPEKMILLLLKQ